MSSSRRDLSELHLGGVAPSKGADLTGTCLGLRGLEGDGQPRRLWEGGPRAEL